MPATYFRYVLTDRESRQGNHINPDMAKWRRAQIDERAAREAAAAGYEAWAIFGPDETLLAQGVRTDGDVG